MYWVHQWDHRFLINIAGHCFPHVCVWKKNGLFFIKTLRKCGKLGFRAIFTISIFINVTRTSIVINYCTIDNISKIFVHIYRNFVAHADEKINEVSLLPIVWLISVSVTNVNKYKINTYFSETFSRKFINVAANPKRR